MHALNLVTDRRTPFFQQQVEALSERGVTETTVDVSGNRTVTNDERSARSAVDYVWFYARVLRHSVESYDIVHANYGLTAPMALAQPTRPVVITLWGSDLLGDIGWLSRRCARRADATIVMSREMADMLDVDAHVIPHGVDLERFRPLPRRQARKAVGWRHDARHVLFPYAAQREKKDFPRAKGVVDRVRERIEGDVELHTLHDVPHEQMPSYMNAADALLMTSVSEGSPNSVKEALACNLPVVSNDVGDLRERLSGVDPSHVCRTDDELDDALVDVLERGGPSNGRETVQELGLDRMSERIRAVYESVS